MVGSERSRNWAKSSKRAAKTRRDGARMLMRIPISLALAVSISCPASALHGADVNVRTESGTVSGVRAPQSNVVSFKGIPFAAPPIGDLRWRPPQPVQPWKGIRQADLFAASCMQHERQEFLPWTSEFLTHNKVGEDCLYLNVWTPKPHSGAKLPVIVFIHGGGFSEGAGDIAVYDGEHLAATGLVIVTINYRLGVFGFLAHPDLTAESEHHASGNYGLLDQIAALQWVRANIPSFGGDPHRVTIWGQSAGAFSVEALVASPLAAGIIERAMADSGIGIAGLPMASLKMAEEAGAKFAAAHHAASIKELRAIPAEDLLPGPQDSPLRFAPDIDGWVLPDSPQALSDRGADNDVAVITGYQAGDGLLFAPRMQTPEQFHQMAEAQYGEMAGEFERLYPAKNSDEVKAMLAQSIQDRDRVSMFLWASRRQKNHRQPVFTYYFDRAIPWPQHPEFGAFHTGEIPYFFLNLKVLDRPYEPVDFKIAQEASTYLKNFAAQGNPNARDLPKWPRVEANAPATMEIGVRTGPMPLADPEKVGFWTRYFASPAGAHAPPF